MVITFAFPTDTERLFKALKVSIAYCCHHCHIGTVVWIFLSFTCLSFLPAAAPEEAPTILSVTPHTTTSVLIRWQVVVALFLLDPTHLCWNFG